MKPTTTSHALVAAVFTLLAWAANPLTTQAQLPDYLPTEGLVGWWPFNGNANDESGNGNDGVVNGATLSDDRDGNPNAAYSFDGVDDVIDLPLNSGQIANSTSFSIQYWLVPNQGQLTPQTVFANWKSNPVQYGTPVSFYTGFYGNNSGWNIFTAYLGGLSVGSSSQLNFQDFNHIVIVFDGSQGISENRQKVYLNSILQSNNYNCQFCSNNIPQQIGNVFDHTTIGARYYQNNLIDPFNGAIDDIAIYNRALTPEEITALYTGVPYVAPCADPAACNFGQGGECVFAEPNLDCAGNCLNDCNNNGVCDEVEVYGCEYPTACNYNPEANVGDGSCTFPEPNYDCAGNCLLDLNNNGLCDLEEVSGCTFTEAANYTPGATLDDGSCFVTCKGDVNNDGQITSADLLSFLSSYGSYCSGAGCMDPAGCNYNPNATFDLGYCAYPAEFLDCNGACLNDADGDGVCDELEFLGCTDTAACNYSEEATEDNGSCQYQQDYFNCDGTPVNDADGDGVPDELEVAGCTDSNACNFNPAATDDNESCDYVSCISIGSPLGGGILGYLFQPGDPGYDPAVPHGIIVSNTDLGIATWGCVNTLIGATSMTLGQAANNTTLITAGCSESNIAAWLCENYSSGGFSDWYLPTYWDLVKMYQNLHSQGLGGFQANYYWTSTELNAYSANLINFQNGQGIDFAKSFVSGRVRAIRYF
ncbi:MAG: hypothetical protein RL226_1557 [Bacteroidota bacterium]|jgi:hypothetical protein